MIGITPSPIEPISTGIALGIWLVFIALIHWWRIKHEDNKQDEPDNN